MAIALSQIGPGIAGARIFRSLKSRDYRRFFTGQALSLIGDWMTMTATAWMAYELEHDAATLGMVVFAQHIPLLLFSPLAGALGDRVNRRKLFCWLQAGCILHSTTLAALTLSGHLTAHVLIGLALVRGMINATEFPTRQTLMVELVGDKANLPNAIALNATLFNVARLIGPSLAGVAILKLGAGWCYVIDAVSGIPVVILMVGITDAGRNVVSKAKNNAFGVVRDGIRYVASDIRLRAPMTLMGVTSLAGFAGTILAPVIAADLLHGDARTFGLIQAATGLGALCSAVFLGLRHSHLGLEKWIRLGMLCVVVGHLIVVSSSYEAVTLAGMMVSGLGAVLVFAGGNTLIQAYVDDEKRGRVMGLFAMVQSLYPVGALIIGHFAASFLGPRLTMLISAAVCLGGAIWFRKRAIPSAPKSPAPSEATVAAFTDSEVASPEKL